MTVNITTDELLLAIQQALGSANDEGARTVAEICEKTGRGATKIRQTLGEMARAGRLEVVRVRRPSIDGRSSSVPAYRLRP